MTPARIKALRFLSKATPLQFALYTGMKNIIMLEAGHQEPTEIEIDALKEVEHKLSLKGVTTEEINKREELYK